MNSLLSEVLGEMLFHLQQWCCFVFCFFPAAYLGVHEADSTTPTLWRGKAASFLPLTCRASDNASVIFLLHD